MAEGKIETEILEREGAAAGTRPVLRDQPGIRVLLLGSTHNNSPPEHMAMTRDEKQYLKIRKYLYIHFKSMMDKDVTMQLSLEFLKDEECCCFFDGVKAFEFDLKMGESKAIKISPKLLTSKASPTASPSGERKEKPKKKRGTPHTRNRALVPVFVDGVRMTTVALRFYNKSSSLGDRTHEAFYFYPQEQSGSRSFIKDVFKSYINKLASPVVLLDQAEVKVIALSTIHTPSPEPMIAAPSAFLIPPINLHDPNVAPCPPTEPCPSPSSYPSSSSNDPLPSSSSSSSLSVSSSSREPDTFAPSPYPSIFTPGPPHPMEDDDEPQWPLNTSSTEDDPYALSRSHYEDSRNRFL